MARRFLRMTRKWLEGAAGLRQETGTKSFTKSAGKCADELISGSLNISFIWRAQHFAINKNVCQFFSDMSNIIFCITPLKTF